jgi:hypothetical protein
MVKVEVVFLLLTEMEEKGCDDIYISLQKQKKLECDSFDGKITDQEAGLLLGLHRLSLFDDKFNSSGNR